MSNSKNSKFIRPRVMVDPKAGPLDFQLVDIHAMDEAVEAEDGRVDEHGVTIAFDDEWDDSDVLPPPPPPSPPKGKQTKRPAQYTVTLFGVTRGGESVSLRACGFQPSFYVRIPDVVIALKSNQAIYNSALVNIKNIILGRVGKEVAARCAVSQCRRGEMFGFTNREVFDFLHVSVPNLATFYKARGQIIKKDGTPIYWTIPGIGGRHNIVLQAYETNIDPMIRFLHARDIRAAGWIHVDTGKYWANDGAPTAAQIEVECDWQSVIANEECMDFAPLTVASWDIECRSLYEDQFPRARKGFEHTATEIIDRVGGTHHGGATLSEMVCEALWGGGDDSVVLHGMSRIVLRDTTIRGDMQIPKNLRGRSGGGGSAQTYRDYVAGLIGHDLPQGVIESMKNKKEAIHILGEFLNKKLGDAFYICGDPIIQIGICIKKLGTPDISEKHIFVWGSCHQIKGAIIHACASEADVILQWGQFIRATDPDVMIGYNISGFDESYVYERAVEIGCDGQLVQLLGRFTEIPSKLDTRLLESSAMGQNIISTITMPGRVRIDMLQYIKRNYSLDSYKLDSVASYFMASDVKEVVRTEAGGLKLQCKSTEGLRVGQFIALRDREGELIEGKYLVQGLAGRGEILCAPVDGVVTDLEITAWNQSKDDIDPRKLGQIHDSGPRGRAQIAKYCIQDCDLVLDLEAKLRAYLNAAAMANVCSVPVGFIFSRGQGIKIESLMFKETQKRHVVIRVLPGAPGADNENEKGNDGDDSEEGERSEGYEGAIVLPPVTGFYTMPIAVLDYASLYPSTIRSENISHDTLVWVRDYDQDGAWINLDDAGATSRYDNLSGRRYIDIDFDILRPDPDDMFSTSGKRKKHPVLVPAGRRVCRYAQPLPGEEKGIIPIIVEGLMNARNATRKQQKTVPHDSFLYQLLELKQLAFKLTGNSVYGQLGSATFKVRNVHLAASVTAYGRKQILCSKRIIETLWPGSRCVYGDTDSLFIMFKTDTPGGASSWDAVMESKRLADEAGHHISMALKAPQDFEFDKIYWMFMLLSKKRYVGNMYEEPELGPASFKRKAMGLAIKRRDFALIVKEVFGGAVDIMLHSQDVGEAVRFIRQKMADLAAGRISQRKLIISRALKRDYADRTRIAHAVLADRIAARDPGNAPAPGDRMTYLYVRRSGGSGSGGASGTQADRIESVAFANEHRLPVDYGFYITNQISKPVSQFMAVALEKIPGFERLGHGPAYYAAIAEAERGRQRKRRPGHGVDEQLVYKRIEKARIADTKQLLFGDAIALCERQANGQRDIAVMFHTTERK